MNIENFRDYCLSKPGVTEEFPFDQNTLVFKVMGKMYALAGIENFSRFNVKCNPDMALELRASYGCVLPGWHMNKKHWNTVVIDGSVPDSLLCEWIDHSYEEVKNSLTKKLKEELANFE